MVTVVEREAQVVGKWAREIVAKRVAIIAVVTILIQLAVSYGWVTPDLSDGALGYVNSALDAVGALVAIVYTRKGVTPNNSPKDNAGVPLVSADIVHAAISEAVKANAVTPPTVADTPVADAAGIPAN